MANTWWQLEAIDGRPVAASPETGAAPYVSFAQRSYGANAGCNGLGGLYVFRGGRLYTQPGAQTEMACGAPRDAQEAAANAIFYASPSVVRDGDRLTLRAKGRVIALRRMAPPRAIEDLPEAWQGTRLRGQSYHLTSIDGDSLNRRPAPRIAFGDATALLTGLGGKIHRMNYRQDGATVTFTGGPGGRLGKTFAGDRLSVVTGPNGEILFAGEGHWLSGDNLRRDRPK